MPGHPLDPRAAGCNLLLRDGATLVRTIDDVLEALGPALERWKEAEALADLERSRHGREGPLPRGDQAADPSSRPAPAVRPSGASAGPGNDQGPPSSASTGAGPRSTVRQDDLRTRILDRLGPSPLAEDQLIRDLGERAAAVAPALTDLELEGRVVRQPGGLLALAA